MLSPRAARSVAILFGGGIGALGAVLAILTEQPGARPTAGIAEQQLGGKSVGPRDASVATRPSRLEPAAPANSAPVTQAVEAGPSSQDGGTSPASTSASDAQRVGPPDVVAAFFKPITSAEERSRAEVACANGKGSACEQLAMTYEAQGNDEASAVQAARFQRLAIGMLVRACRGSEADACCALAEMHTTGRGMKRSETKARALIDRAHMLCRINKQQPVCAGLLASTAAANHED
jgi:TPR repeat protein